MGQQSVGAAFYVALRMVLDGCPPAKGNPVVRQ
jgi:hypothetical protein